MVGAGKVGVIVARFEGLRGSSCPARRARVHSPPSHPYARHPLAGIFSRWWRTCQRTVSLFQTNVASRGPVLLPLGELDGAMHARDQKAQQSNVGRRAPILLPFDTLDGATQSCMQQHEDGTPATGLRGGNCGRPPKVPDTVVLTLPSPSRLRSRILCGCQEEGERLGEAQAELSALRKRFTQIEAAATSEMEEAMAERESLLAERDALRTEIDAMRAEQTSGAWTSPLENAAQAFLRTQGHLPRTLHPQAAIPEFGGTDVMRTRSQASRRSHSEPREGPFAMDLDDSCSSSLQSCDQTHDSLLHQYEALDLLSAVHLMGDFGRPDGHGSSSDGGSIEDLLDPGADAELLSSVELLLSRCQELCQVIHEQMPGLQVEEAQ